MFAATKMTKLSSPRDLETNVSVDWHRNVRVKGICD